MERKEDFSLVVLSHSFLSFIVRSFFAHDKILLTKNLFLSLSVVCVAADPGRHKTVIIVAGEEVRTGFARKTPEIAGTWKLYSVRKISRFFSGDFRPISCSFRQKSIGKYSKIFRPEYCSPAPAISGVFFCCRLQ